jgi:hypothetical protein
MWLAVEPLEPSVASGFGDDDENAGQLDEIQESVFGRRGAEHVHPDLDLRVRIRHRQMNVSHRDPRVIRRRELSETD